jgi:AraC-like DNA-binding protein
MTVGNDDKLLAANYPAVLSRLMAQKGISSTLLFEGTSFSESKLVSPDTLVSLNEYLTLITNAKKYSAEPALGLHLGEALGVTTHGMTGIAAMSCKTFGEAVETASRYFVTRFPAINVTCQKHEFSNTFTLEDNADLGIHKRFIIESIFASIYTIAKFLIGDNAEYFITEFTTPAAPYQPSYEGIFGNSCQFERTKNRMICNAKLWPIPLKFFDPSMRKIAIDKCDAELQELKIKGGVRQQVKDILRNDKQGFPSIDMLARQLNLSPRTISRKLKLEKTSFQEILDEERKRRAINYLTQTELSITQITHELNFNDSAYFTRAFKRWTGYLPSHFRKSALSK